ncbi:MAG: hypothetical protein HYU64_01625, partial [Armatimonadetes bacterium]|nr:hypothetical protein [Armatimonadota bacterium]
MENVIQPTLQPAVRNIGGQGSKIGGSVSRDPEDLYFNEKSEGTPVRTWFPPEIDVKGFAGCTFVGDPEAEARKVAEGNSRFALELYSKLAA